MPARPCINCGQLTRRNSPRCVTCQQLRDHKRNAQPNKRAHKTARHRTLKAYVFARDNYTCALCGNTESLTLDYIQPLPPIGHGTQTADNARTLCLSCNSRLGATVRRGAHICPR